MKTINDANETTRRTLHTPTAGLRVRATEEGEEPGHTIEGYAIRFGSPSVPLYEDESESIREVIEREAVTQELLDRSDIKFTLFHHPHLLLARSKNGEGTLSYELREDGVFFSFTAPRTADGDKALELVRNGVIDGCSFAFTTKYRDKAYVERKVTAGTDGRRQTVCHVKRMTGIYDMTITPDPAYPSTSVENRDLISMIRSEQNRERETMEKQIREMREETVKKIF